MIVIDLVLVYTTGAATNEVMSICSLMWYQSLHCSGADQVEVNSSAKSVESSASLV